jgi:hypothetical protein
LGFKNMLPVQNRKFHCPSFLTLTWSKILDCHYYSRNAFYEHHYPMSLHEIQNMTSAGDNRKCIAGEN